MVAFLINTLLLSVVVFAVARILPGVHLKNFVTAIIVAVVYSVINLLLQKLLIILSLPAVLITFGLFVFLINAFLLWLTDKLISDFKIDGLGNTLLAAVLITLGNMLLHWIF